MAISLIGKLYAIAKRVKAENTDTKYKVRQQEARSQLEKIRDCLDRTLRNTLAKGLLGKALSYLDKN